MFLRTFLHEPGSCASYLFGSGTHGKLGVVDAHAELVDEYLATAASLGAPIVAVFDTHVQADRLSGALRRLGVRPRAFREPRLLLRSPTGPDASALLVAGWAVVLPVPALIALAPSWWVVVAANVLLGVSQGLAWSMTVAMKIDFAGPARRGLALGLNEAAGYLGVAATALATGALAASYAPRTVVWIGAAVIAAAGLALSVVFVRDTADHVELEAAGSERVQARVHDTAVLRSCSQAGFVNNLNDALAWGLAPLYLAAHGAGAHEIGVVAAAYPVVGAPGSS